MAKGNSNARRKARKRKKQRLEQISANLSQPLSEVQRKTDIRTASTMLAKAHSYGWSYDKDGNPRNVAVVVNPVGTKR